MKTSDWRRMVVPLGAILCGCSYSPTPDPGALASSFNQTMIIFGMSPGISQTAADLLTDVNRAGSSWFNVMNTVLVDQAAINFVTGSVIETQLPDTPSQEFWHVVDSQNDPNYDRMATYLRSRINALTYNLPGWANVYIAHRMENNQSCALGAFMGWSQQGIDKPATNRADRWSIMYAEDIKYYAENCAPIPGPRFQTAFAWFTTHEVGHQIGLTGTDLFNQRHRAIAERLNDNTPRHDVMVEDLSLLLPDMEQFSTPLFCHTAGSRRGTAELGSPPQDNCADNLFRFHLAQ